MREILFRGKGIDDNWYYGVPVVYTEDCVIMAAPHTYSKKVESNTLGQYTGLTDKNGKKIFEGDIIKSNGNNRIAISVIRYGEFEPKLFYDLIEDYVSRKGIRPTEKIVGLYAESLKGEQMLITNASNIIEVIGNIHDNPELLKGGADE